MRRSAISCVRAWRRCAALRQARQQLSGFLLRHGHHYNRPAWTLLHRRWLAGLSFDQAVHHIVLEDCIAAVEAATARRDRLEATSRLYCRTGSCTRGAALQALRGVGPVAAATLVAESATSPASPIPASSWRIPAGRRPSIPAAARAPGGITKAGNR